MPVCLQIHVELSTTSATTAIYCFVLPHSLHPFAVFIFKIFCTKLLQKLTVFTTRAYTSSINSVVWQSAGNLTCLWLELQFDSDKICLNGRLMDKSSLAMNNVSSPNTHSYLVLLVFPFCLRWYSQIEILNSIQLVHFSSNDEFQ